MSGTLTFKCPSCGGYMEFEPQGQRFRCPYCGREGDVEELKAESGRGEEAASAPDRTAQEASDAMDENLRTYHCQMCGAELITSATTAATHCYYCHSPVVLSDRLSGSFKPDGVIPFQLTREEAEKQFEQFLHRKHFIDRRFFSPLQREMFSGVYYPYWYCDVEGTATFSGEGTRVNVVSGPREVVTTTRVFRVEREGKLAFRQMAKKALNKLDGQLADGIHPFQERDMKPYTPGYLSGFLADARDIPEKNACDEAIEEARGYAAQLMRGRQSFDTLTGKTTFHPVKAAARYVLLPAWVLTYRASKDGVPYYYLMNGQTGRVCGQLPINKAKLYGVAAALGGLVFGLLCLGGALLW